MNSKEDYFFSPNTHCTAYLVLWYYHRLETHNPFCKTVWKCQKSSCNKNKNLFISTANVLVRFLNLRKEKTFAEVSLMEKIWFNNSIGQILGEYLLCVWPCRNAKFRSPSTFTKQGFHSFPININGKNEQSWTYRADKSWVTFKLKNKKGCKRQYDMSPYDRWHSPDMTTLASPSSLS